MAELYTSISKCNVIHRLIIIKVGITGAGKSYGFRYIEQTGELDDHQTPTDLLGEKQ